MPIFFPLPKWDLGQWDRESQTENGDGTGIVAKNKKIGWEVGFMQISIFDISIAIFLSKVLPAGIMGLILVNKASPSSTLVRSVLVSDLTFGINVA